MGKGVIGKEEEKEIGTDCEMEEGDFAVGSAAGTAIGSAVGSTKGEEVVSNTWGLDTVRGEKSATTEGYEEE